MTMGNGEARIPISILTSVFEAVGNVEKTRFALSHRHWRSEEDGEVAASRRATLIGPSSIYLCNYFLLNGQQALNKEEEEEEEEE